MRERGRAYHDDQITALRDSDGYSLMDLSLFSDFMVQDSPFSKEFRHYSTAKRKAKRAEGRGVSCDYDERTTRVP